MQFGTFGPFKVPRDEYGNIERALSDFWEEVNSEWSGLASGRGCYIFGIAPSGGSRVEPWYVGKTNNQGFEAECFNAHIRAIITQAPSVGMREDGHVCI